MLDGMLDVMLRCGCDREELDSRGWCVDILLNNSYLRTWSNDSFHVRDFFHNRLGALFGVAVVAMMLWVVMVVLFMFVTVTFP